LIDVEKLGAFARQFQLFSCSNATTPQGFDWVLIAPLLSSGIKTTGISIKGTCLQVLGWSYGGVRQQWIKKNT